MKEAEATTEVSEETKKACVEITPDPDPPVEEKKKEPQNSSTPNQLIAKENGMLVGGTLEDQWRLAQYYANSGMLPAQYNGQPAKVLTATQYCYELGLKPLSGMRQLAVIDGTPAIYGDLPLAIVRRSGQLEYIEEFRIDADDKKICRINGNLGKFPFAAICIVKRKDARSEFETFFSLEDAKRAKLYPNPKDKAAWNKYPQTMMKYRARSEALKSEFGDILSGMPIAEYDYNTTVDGRGRVMDIDHDGNDRPADQGSAIMEAADKSEPIEVKGTEVKG